MMCTWKFNIMWLKTIGKRECTGKMSHSKASSNENTAGWRRCCVDTLTSTRGLCSCCRSAAHVGAEPAEGRTDLQWETGFFKTPPPNWNKLVLLWATCAVNTRKTCVLYVFLHVAVREYISQNSIRYTIRKKKVLNLLFIYCVSVSTCSPFCNAE